MSKLLLIRHCQTNGRHPDAPLTEAGTRAAEALVTPLHDLAPDAVYSSPYERAHATVRPFATSAGLSVQSRSVCANETRGAIDVTRALVLGPQGILAERARA